jgi:hypothetical protein
VDHIVVQDGEIASWTVVFDPYDVRKSVETQPSTSEAEVLSPEAGKP